MRVSCYPSSPCGQGTASSFYRPRGGDSQSCRVALSAVCGSMVYIVMDLTAVMENLASGRRRGGSCARPGAASRVVALESSFDRCPYANSRAWLTEDWRLDNGGRGDVMSTWVPTVLGMTLQCLGWWHNGRDGHTGPEVIQKTRPASLTSRCHPRWVRIRWPYPFRGCRRPLSRGDMEEVWEWAAQCHGMTPAFPHSTRTTWGDGRTVRVGRTAPGYDSQMVSEGRRGGDSPLTRAPARRQRI
jgi:hypothetical protein